MSLLSIPNEEYHARPGVSASMLKSMASGWRSFEAEYITKTAPRKESAAMALGTAVHAALLEPEAFADEYAVIPEECSDRRTKAYKEWAANNGDRKTLSPNGCPRNRVIATSFSSPTTSLSPGSSAKYSVRAVGAGWESTRPTADSPSFA